jgi:nucleoside diphosphate kinase
LEKVTNQRKAIKGTVTQNYATRFFQAAVKNIDLEKKALSHF